MTNHAFSLLIVALVAVVGLIGFLVVWIVCRPRKRRPILAMQSGRVIEAGLDGSHNDSKYGGLHRGTYAAISSNITYNGRPVICIYAHLDSLTVKPGQTVKKGQLIGYAANNRTVDIRD